MLNTAPSRADMINSCPLEAWESTHLFFRRI